MPVFAYSPLGRGFLSNSYKTPADIPKNSILAMLPRFQGEAFYANITLVQKLEKLAKANGISSSQLALAWVTHLSPFVSRLQRRR